MTSPSLLYAICYRATAGSEPSAINGLVFEFRHHFRRKQFKLTPCFIPGDQTLIEVPAKPFDTAIFAQRIEFMFDVIGCPHQGVFGFHHALERVRDGSGFAWEAVRFKKAEAGEVFNEPCPLGVSA